MLWLGFILLLITALAIIIIPLMKSYSMQSVKLQILLLILLVPALSFFLYHKIGSAPQLAMYQKISADKARTQKVIVRMEQILKLHPDSTKGWYLLGRLYLSQQDFPAALTAFTKANNLEPNNVSVLQQLVATEFIVQQEHFTATLAKHLARLQQLAPRNPTVLNLQAIRAYQAHHYADAIVAWQQLREQFPPNSNDYKNLTLAIVNSQKLLDTSH